MGFVEQTQGLGGGVYHHPPVHCRMGAAPVTLKQRRAIGRLHARDHIAERRLRNAE